jgi:hypothetical protein
MNNDNNKPPCENIIVQGILKSISCVSSHGVKMIKSLPTTTTTTTIDLENLKNAAISFFSNLNHLSLFVKNFKKNCAKNNNKIM